MALLWQTVLHPIIIHNTIKKQLKYKCLVYIYFIFWADHSIYWFYSDFFFESVITFWDSKNALILNVGVSGRKLGLVGIHYSGFTKVKHFQFFS